MTALAKMGVTAALTFAALAPPCGGKTLAVVDGKAITEADVSATFGYLPRGQALREATEALVEREIILALARSKALAVSPEDNSRAATLAARAYSSAPGSGAGRGYLAEEIVIEKYIDLYIFPRIKVDEETLTAYFISHASSFLKRPPRDRASLKKAYPSHRNEVLSRYVKKEIARLLGETGNAARTELGVEIYD